MAEKGRHFNQLTAEESRELFAKFVGRWNAKKLPAKYYAGLAAPVSMRRTGHDWGLRGRSAWAERAPTVNRTRAPRMFASLVLSCSPYQMCPYQMCLCRKSLLPGVRSRQMESDSLLDNGSMWKVAAGDGNLDMPCCSTTCTSLSGRESFSFILQIQGAHNGPISSLNKSQSHSGGSNRP